MLDCSWRLVDWDFETQTKTLLGGRDDSETREGVAARVAGLVVARGISLRCRGRHEAARTFSSGRRLVSPRANTRRTISGGQRMFVVVQLYHLGPSHPRLKQKEFERKVRA